MASDNAAAVPWTEDPHTPGFKPLIARPVESLDFSAWWSKPLFQVGGFEVSRSWMVLSVVNYDGGAHVDPAPSASYLSLTRNGALKPVRVNSAGTPYRDFSDPLPSGIRTICNEAIWSLEALEGS